MGRAGGERLSDRGLLPGRYDPRFARVFGWYTRRLLRKRFFAVRLAREDAAMLRGLAHHEGPLVIALAHPSWWDPLLAVLLAREFLPERSGCGPMDADQLRRFGLFRRLGLFGVDPDDPASLRAMGDYVAEVFAREARPTFYVTPQGHFTDPRDPVRLRPGAAAVAAAHPMARAVVVALEYAFWQDQRPEAFLAAAECRPARRTMTGWHRTLQSSLQAEADRLALLVRARDPEPFETLVGDEQASIQPVYDLWLRVTGRGGAIAARRRAEEATGPR
ncbi:MAG: lysophospholipid acyltransferase family protein [Phycisphaerales bacterium]|nr:lysophospholipid acyltransferase family protein [Phycisphaerales bacterium]